MLRVLSIAGIVLLLGGIGVGLGCADGGGSDSAGGPGGKADQQGAGFSVVEGSIPEMQRAMAQGSITSRQIVQQYLDRIARYDGTLHGVLTLHAQALAQADALDAERAQGHVRGPLHGIPIALKDIINTTDLPTTGGAWALKGYTPPYEATLVGNLRAAGAIVLAKTTLTELANSVSDTMPDNYSAVGGQGYSPYDTRPDPRNGDNDGRPLLPPGSSSSGIGTTANFWAGNVGTETAGSILWPSNQNSLVGIKPTVGRISRYGVIPVSMEQDTPGPMTKSVADAAILLGAMESASPDPKDPATARCAPPPGRDYTQFLHANALVGARIGIPRAYFYEPTTTTPKPMGGLIDDQGARMAEAIAILKSKGAIIVDPANLPSAVDPDPGKNLALWDICGTEPRGADQACSTVLKYAMKRDLNAYFASLGESAPVKSLADLIGFNLAHAAQAIKYGQSLLEVSEEQDLEADRARFEADRARDLDVAGTRGIDAVMQQYHLDALLLPGDWGAGCTPGCVAARPGYPVVAVPVGTVTHPADPPLPAGQSVKPWPYGVTFTGLACSEPRLIAIAYAFEQASHRRIPPPEFP